MEEIILLGRGPSWIECTWDAEVWCTESVLLMDGVRLDKISKVFAFDANVRQALKIAKENSLPVVSTRDYKTEPYPAEGIFNEFRTPFLCPTISYMLAMAIYQGYQKLRLYGIDQGPDWQYLSTKPYVTFWLGVAVGRGIEYTLPETSLLMKQFEYEIQSAIEKADNYRMKVLPLLNQMPRKV